MDDPPIYTEHQGFEDPDTSHKPKWLGQDRLYRWNTLRTQLNGKICNNILTKLQTKDDILSCLKIDSNISQEFVNNPGIENAGSALQKKFGHENGLLLNDFYFLFGLPRVVKIIGNAYKNVEFEGGFATKEEYESSIHESERGDLDKDFSELGMSYKNVERNKFVTGREERNLLAASRKERDTIAASRKERNDIAASRKERDDIATSRRDWDDIATSRRDWDDIAASRRDWDDIAASRKDRDDIAASRKEKNDIAASRKERYDIAASRKERDDIAASRKVRDNISARDDIATSQYERDKLAASRYGRNRLEESKKPDELGRSIRNDYYDYPDVNYEINKKDKLDDRRDMRANEGFSEFGASSRRPESAEYQSVIRRERDGSREGELGRSRRREFDSGVEDALWHLDQTLDAHYNI